MMASAFALVPDFGASFIEVNGAGMANTCKNLLFQL